MFVIPIGVFYSSFYLIFNGNNDKLGYCGILAIIAVNCVIAAYVRMAWFEDRPDSTSKQIGTEEPKTD